MDHAGAAEREPVVCGKHDQLERAQRGCAAVVPGQREISRRDLRRFAGCGPVSHQYRHHPPDGGSERAFEGASRAGRRIRGAARSGSAMRRSLWLLFPALLLAQQPVPREQRGAPLVNVTHAGAVWTLAGQKNRVTFNERDFAIAVQTGPTTWKMTSSLPDDMLVKSRGRQFPLRLTDGRARVEPYDTGYKTGIKISLDQFRHATPLDLRLYL